MNQSAIKKFAIGARSKLKEAVRKKADTLGISKEKIKDIEYFKNAIQIKGFEENEAYSNYKIKQRESLLSHIKKTGFEETVEEVAYTWFQRFIFLRYMEVNDYFPTGVRVVTSTKERKVQVDRIDEILNLDWDKEQEIVYKWINRMDIEHLHQYLFIKQCNELHKIMPMIFEKIPDYVELLFPDHLLKEDLIIEDIVEIIGEEECKDQVEMIGWIYQYYISEKKDQVFFDLQNNKKITKENIAVATQFFTPKWIIKYMIENSLGRLWIDSYPDEELKSQWKYYIEETKQDLGVQKKLDRLKNPHLNPEEIRLLDPSVGSGHILVYAFDILYDIYLKSNYPKEEIPQLILEKNLYGIDIDDRVCQLASFALMMKARSKDSRIFDKKISLNICSIQESNRISKEALKYFCRGDQKSPGSSDTILEDIQYLIEAFQNAKEYGSILDIKNIDFNTIERRIEEIKKDRPLDLFELQYQKTILSEFPILIKQAKIMSQKYDIVCTNPPYMGIRRMNSDLAKYVSEHYPNSKSDLFTVFMEVAIRRVLPWGYISIINPHSWMFLSSYEKLRKIFKTKCLLYNMLHLGSKAFEENVGTIVQNTAFVARRAFIPEYKSVFIRLVDFHKSIEKQHKLLNLMNYQSTPYVYIRSLSEFSHIPGRPLAYWCSQNVMNTFKNHRKLGSITAPRQGMATSDNKRFVRLWHEVSVGKIGFDYTSREDALLSNYKWFPYNKGGKYRKWFGNNEYIVNWEKDGKEIKEFAASLYNSYTRTIKNIEYYFKKCITYTFISENMGVRYSTEGFIFDVSGSSIFIQGENLYYILAFLCSKLANMFLDILNPTFNIQVGDVKNLPIIEASDLKTKERIINLVKENISIAKKDWDFFETSWNFKTHPILKYKENAKTIKQAFTNWTHFVEKQFLTLKRNEEELNGIFINIYRLQGELSSKVEDREITIRKSDREREIKSFLSYAVGCLFGRYSLDEEGLICAGEEFDQRRYKTLIPTKDNILVIAEDNYFKEDILNRFIEFIRVTFGESSLEENLDYIAETLGGNSRETSRQTIRKYFLKDFYKDHLKIYGKRPIYWLFDSGRENGLKALIYMHRYDYSLVARIRMDYLHRLQKIYKAEEKKLNILIQSDIFLGEKANAKKKKEHIYKQIDECRIYDQVLAHVANQRIEIDLDDGVKINYNKFQRIEIPLGKGRKPLKKDLLAKI